MSNSKVESGVPRSAIWRRLQALREMCPACPDCKYRQIGDHCRLCTRIDDLETALRACADAPPPVIWHRQVQAACEVVAAAICEIHDTRVAEKVLKAVNELRDLEVRACAEATDKETRVDLSGTLFALACQNMTRAFAHLRDDQLCGIWPDGSALRGDHIKHLFGDLQDEAIKALRACADELKTAQLADVQAEATHLDYTELVALREENRRLRACADALAPAPQNAEETKDDQSRSETQAERDPLQSSAATDGAASAPAPNEDTARFHERVEREIAALEALPDLPPSLVPAVRAARRLMQFGPTRDYDMPEPVDAHAAAMLTTSLQHFLTERTMHAAWRKRAEEADAPPHQEPE